MSWAMMGVRMASTSATISRMGLPRPRSLPRPPQNMLRKMKSERRAAIPSSTATISINRMSKLRTCESSWAITPCNSFRSSLVSSPRVTATDECFGSRPVAKAFGALSSIT